LLRTYVVVFDMHLSLTNAPLFISASIFDGIISSVIAMLLRNDLYGFHYR